MSTFSRRAVLGAAAALGSSVSLPVGIAQQSQAPLRTPRPPLKVAICTLIAVNGRTLMCSRDGAPLTVVLSDKTSIRKKGPVFNLRDLQPGDRLSITFDDEGGRPFVKDIWVNVVSVDGIVAKVVSDSTLEVRETFRLEPTGKTLRVKIDEATTCRGDMPLREAIAPGRSVRIIGVDMRDGTIYAESILPN